MKRENDNEDDFENLPTNIPERKKNSKAAVKQNQENEWKMSIFNRSKSFSSYFWEKAFIYNLQP